MQCNSCGYLVPQNLKFAIMKNFCPQCGKKLFTEKDLNHISLIQTKISSQPFAKNCEEQEVFDMALFFFREFSVGYGRILVEEEFKKIAKERASAIEVKNNGDEEPDIADLDFEEVLENDKKSIIEQAVARVSLEHSEDEDLQSKADRLREVYKRAPIKIKNPTVRRLDED